MSDTWKDVFDRQWGTGKFWSDLMKDDFPRRKFLEYEDVLYIAKKAQSDAYDGLIEKFKATPLAYIIPEIELMKENIWKDGED